jgi:hypothetical protein
MFAINALIHAGVAIACFVQQTSGVALNPVTPLAMSTFFGAITMPLLYLGFAPARPRPPLVPSPIQSSQETEHAGRR